MLQHLVAPVRREFYQGLEYVQVHFLAIACDHWCYLLHPALVQRADMLQGYLVTSLSPTSSFCLDLVVDLARDHVLRSDIDFHY